MSNKMETVLLGGRKLTDLRVVDLRQELENRGLEKSGVKAVLVVTTTEGNFHCYFSKNIWYSLSRWWRELDNSKQAHSESDRSVCNFCIFCRPWRKKRTMKRKTMKRKPPILSQLIAWVSPVKTMKTKNSPQRVRLLPLWGRDSRRKLRSPQTWVSAYVVSCVPLFLIYRSQVELRILTLFFFFPLYREESCTESGRSWRVGQCELNNTNIVQFTVNA